MVAFDDETVNVGFFDVFDLFEVDFHLLLDLHVALDDAVLGFELLEEIHEFNFCFFDNDICPPKKSMFLLAVTLEGLVLDKPGCRRWKH